MIYGLTAEDARAEDNEALKSSATNGHLDVVQYLCEDFGLTTDDTT